MKKIYYNGEIYTGTNETVNYVVTEKNMIVEVGYDPNIKKHINFKGEAIDLNGGMMFSGFIDAHAHPFTAAFQQSQIINDFSMSENDVLDNVRDYITLHPEKESFFGAGHNETIFGKEGPKKEKLDSICSNKPIILLGCGGHDAWVNSKTLEKAGIDKKHKDPVPGFQFYRRNSAGEATGHLLESGPLTEVIQAVKPFVIEEVEEKLQSIFNNFSRYGITTIGDCGIICYLETEGRKLLDKCIAEKKLKQRIFGSNHLTERAHIDNWFEQLDFLSNRYDSDSVRIRTFKVVNDGTIESRSAAMMKPFIGESEVVEPLLYGKKYRALCVEVAKAGFDLHLHGIGDRANHENLMAAIAVREAGFWDTRITNAHTQYLIDDDIPLFGKYNIIANTTGVWLYGDDLPKAIVGKRADKTFKMKSILNYGGRMSLGSDFPGDEFGISPLSSIETGVTRQMLGKPKSKILKPYEERLDIEDMIKGFTETPAYAFRMENKLGKIEKDRYADFTILCENIFEKDKYKIHEIPIMMTIMNGEIIYSKENYFGYM